MNILIGKSVAYRCGKTNWFSVILQGKCIGFFSVFPCKAIATNGKIKRLEDSVAAVKWLEQEEANKQVWEKKQKEWEDRKREEWYCMKGEPYRDFSGKWHYEVDEE